MKTYLTAKQYAEYKQMCHDRDHGRLLTPDGLRFVCASHNYDPEEIGRHFLEVLGGFELEKTQIALCVDTRSTVELADSIVTACD